MKRACGPKWAQWDNKSQARPMTNSEPCPFRCDWLPRSESVGPRPHSERVREWEGELRWENCHVKMLQNIPLPDAVARYSIFPIRRSPWFLRLNLNFTVHFTSYSCMHLVLLFAYSVPRLWFQCTWPECVLEVCFDRGIGLIPNFQPSLRAAGLRFFCPLE